MIGFRRESLKQQIAGDKLSKEKNKKSSTLLCAKKHNKKKKKKTSYNSYIEGNYPIYSSTLDGKTIQINMNQYSGLYSFCFLFFLLLTMC